MFNPSLVCAVIIINTFRLYKIASFFISLACQNSFHPDDITKHQRVQRSMSSKKKTAKIPFPFEKGIEECFFRNLLQFLCTLDFDEQLKL
jgi:hypothetical protein